MLSAHCQMVPCWTKVKTTKAIKYFKKYLITGTEMGIFWKYWLMFKGAKTKQTNKQRIQKGQVEHLEFKKMETSVQIMKVSGWQLLSPQRELYISSNFWKYT